METGEGREMTDSFMAEPASTLTSEKRGKFHGESHVEDTIPTTAWEYEKGTRK